MLDKVETPRAVQVALVDAPPDELKLDDVLPIPPEAVLVGEVDLPPVDAAGGNPDPSTLDVIKCLLLCL